MRKPEISNLHLITSDSPYHSLEELVVHACEAGVKWIQLRMKDVPFNEVISNGHKVRAITKKYDVILIVNDHIDIAKEIDADGVHLGKEDDSPAFARKILGDQKIVGGTANTIEDIKRLTAMGVDYIGVGPFRFTSTKKNLSPVLGAEGIARLAQVTNIPVIAIGGILPEDVNELLRTGIHGIAVAGAINNHQDIHGKLKEFHSILTPLINENR
jgi:thiamine-phosphate pyrophosphorylase